MQRNPAGRATSTFLSPGDWSTKPNNLLDALRPPSRRPTASSPDAAAWTVLATAANGSGTPYPYLLARRYGNGMIVLGGDDIRLSPAKMLENFVWYQEHATKGERSEARHLSPFALRKLRSYSHKFSHVACITTRVGGPWECLWLWASLTPV